MERATPTDVADRATAAFRSSRHVRIGAEVEWLVFHSSDPAQPVPAATTSVVAAGRLPAGGTIAIEPGGQVELVTRPAPHPAALVAAVEADTDVLVERFAAHDLVLVPLGLDPVRPARRTLDVPRYEAMERYFLERAPAGIDMMNRTASLQLNIDFGPDPESTWRRAHLVAPFLAAAFANSPTADGVDFRPVSHRQRVWSMTDPSRTRPVGAAPTDWHRYILDAQVMLHARDSGIEPPSEPHTFAEWLRGGDPPTRSELDLHLTTLFPPLRPRGYLELRMIDALPRAGRAAAIATVWTLLTDPAAGAEVATVCTTIADPWGVAAAEGLGSPDLRERAGHLLQVVATRLQVPHPPLARACEHWRAGVERATVPATIDALLASAERSP